GRVRDDPVAGCLAGEEGRGRVQAGCPPLPRAGRDRRDRARTQGRRPCRPCRGGAAPGRVAAGGAGRSRRRARVRALQAPKGQVSVTWRLRVVDFSRFGRRLSTASTGLSPANETACKRPEHGSRPVKPAPSAVTPRWVEKRELPFYARPGPKPGRFHASPSGDEAAMPPRPIWSGTISFGLVSVPVRMFPATQSKELRFHFVDRRDLMPVGYDKVRKDTGEHVDAEDVVRAFEIEKGRYVPIEPDDLDRLDVELTHAVDICDFVALEEIDPIYFRQAYYLAPQE